MKSSMHVRFSLALSLRFLLANAGRISYVLHGYNAQYTVEADASICPSAESIRIFSKLTIRLSPVLPFLF
jgi:hypothetical protein